MIYNKEYILNSLNVLFQNKFGKCVDKTVQLKADASERKIYRLISGEISVIGIFNENINENKSFIYFTNIFSRAEMNVPDVLESSEDGKFYLEKDLGDVTLYRYISGKTFEDLLFTYKKILRDLLKFQIESYSHIDFGKCYKFSEFNSAVINHDLNKFYGYYVKNICADNFTEGDKVYLSDYFSKLIYLIKDKYFLYRDFQPRNIMLFGDKIFYIDYQSGMRGPLHYDLASFLYSGSITLSEKDIDILLKYYLNELKNYIITDESVFIRNFYGIALLRLLQVLGSYGYLYHNRNENIMKEKMKKALFNLEKLKSFIADNRVRKIMEGITGNSNIN